MTVPGINSSAVIEAIRVRSERWAGGRREPDGKIIGLVIEGGAMRGIRSAGALLGLDLLGFRGIFDDVYASSAGAVNAAYFLSGQGAYGVTIYYQNINNRKFINRFRFRKVVDLDFLFDHVLVHEKPLQVSQVMKAPSRFFVAVTEAPSAEARLIHVQESNMPLITLLKASSALPIAYNESVLIDGTRYIDGGLSNSIPLANAVANGCTDILVLLTRPPMYRKPDAGRLERLLFRATCGRNNDSLCDLHRRSGRHSNRMRDIAFGRKPCEAPVNIATFSPGPHDVSIDRTTINARRLKLAAIQSARRTFDAFGADYDRISEILEHH